MQINPNVEIKEPVEGVAWIKEAFKLFRLLYQNLVFVINGNITFGDGTSPDNIRGAWAKPTSVAGNFVVTHNLNRIPVGWLMVSTDVFENLKFISSTTTTITLAGQTGGAHVTLFIF